MSYLITIYRLSSRNKAQIIDNSIGDRTAVSKFIKTYNAILRPAQLIQNINYYEIKAL